MCGWFGPNVLSFLSTTESLLPRPPWASSPPASCFCAWLEAGDVLLDSSLIPSPPIMPWNRVMSTIHDAQADRLDALIAIPGHAFVEHADEFVHGDTREVSFMKEILLESAEEVLRCRVIWAVSLYAPIECVRSCSLQIQIHLSHR